MAGMMNYKMMKMMAFFATGVIPVILCFMFLLLGFPILGILIFTTITAFFMAWAANLMTSKNVWIKAIQGECIVVLDVNSTGMGKAYPGTIVNNRVGGIDLNIDFENGKEEKMVYERDITHRMKAVFGSVVKKIPHQQTKEGESIYANNYDVQINLPKDDYQQSLWSFGYLTFAFYDSVAGTLLTKPQLSTKEKELMVEYISLNEWRELKNLNMTMRDFTRNTFDLISARFGGILKNPVVIILIVAIIVLVIIVAGILFVPGVSQALAPAVSSATTSTGAAMKPIIGGGA